MRPLVNTPPRGVPVLDLFLSLSYETLSSLIRGTSLLGTTP